RDFHVTGVQTCALPILVVLLLSLVLTMLVAPFAGATTGEQCSPDASTACIQGRIRTAAGDPAVGVKLSVEGQGFTGEAITDDDEIGRASWREGVWVAEG